MKESPEMLAKIEALAGPVRREPIANGGNRVHEIRVEGFVPVPLNRLLSLHWAKAGRAKRADRAVIAIHAAGVPRVTKVRSERPRTTGTGKPTKGRLLAGTGPKRRVSIEVTLAKGERRYDDDALLKTVWDALVALDLLVTDSPVWCENGGVTWKRGPRRATRILLEDLR